MNGLKNVLWKGDVMKNNYRMRTVSSIIAYTLLIIAFWAMQYGINPHLVPSMTKVAVEYICGVILCGIVSGWLNRCRSCLLSNDKEL